MRRARWCVRSRTPTRADHQGRNAPGAGPRREQAGRLPNLARESEDTAVNRRRQRHRALLNVPRAPPRPRRTPSGDRRAVPQLEEHPPSIAGGRHPQACRRHAASRATTSEQALVVVRLARPRSRRGLGTARTGRDRGRGHPAVAMLGAPRRRCTTPPVPANLVQNHPDNQKISTRGAPACWCARGRRRPDESSGRSGR